MEKPKIGELITKYTWQIIAVIFFIIVMWLNSNYVGVDLFDEHTDEYDALIIRVQGLEFQSQSNDSEIETLKRRLQTYVNRYGELSTEMDNNENNIIILQTEMKHVYK